MKTRRVARSIGPEHGTVSPELVKEAAWQTLYSTTSRPFPAPKTGTITVKVINH